ncbi:hypothetical protein Q8A73_003548 [Channa argus]|nr:hypothetical protein Q8A73_003548 [Channa argus]
MSVLILPLCHSRKNLRVPGVERSNPTVVIQGSEMVEAQCQRFEVRSADGQTVLFSADEEEVSIGTEKLRVTGNEGVVFSHSVETSHVRAEPFQDLKLESPTRTLTLEAPRGVEVNAGVGDFTASCRKDLLLQSSEGEIFLDANTIRLGNIPLGSAVDPLEGAPPGTTYTKQTVYELCACANGKLYLSPAEKGITPGSFSRITPRSASSPLFPAIERKKEEREARLERGETVEERWS